MRIAVLACWVLSMVFARAEDRPLFLPFDLTLGGQKAVMAEGNELFAQIGDPVMADAVLKLEKEVPMLIVNAFPCKEDGTVEDTQAVGVIFANNTAEVKLSDTMDKQPLKPGTYLANVVAEGKTARIVFRVAAPGEKLKADFGRIFEFLKKKAGG